MNPAPPVLRAAVREFRAAARFSRLALHSAFAPTERERDALMALLSALFLFLLLRR